MNSFSRIWVGGGFAVLCAVVGSLAWSRVCASTSDPGNSQRARIAFSQALPKLDGDHLKATVVEVNYGPGEASPAHSHPCAVIGYVVEGTLRTQVKGQPELIYRAGESFYEVPNGVHVVSANASKTESTRFLAYFVCDHDTPLSFDVPETKSPGNQ